MSFYENLRDNVAGRLILSKGQTGTYRIYGAEAYDNATGKTTKGTPTDLAMYLLELPQGKSGGPQEFSEEVMARTSAMLLVSAKEFAAGGVTPKVDEDVIYDGRTTRVVGIKRVALSGVAVIYKMAVQHV